MMNKQVFFEQFNLTTELFYNQRKAQPKTNNETFCLHLFLRVTTL